MIREEEGVDKVIYKGESPEALEELQREGLLTIPPELLDLGRKL